jgi:hypothetical protein
MIEVFLNSGEVVEISVAEELSIINTIDLINDLYGKDQWKYYLNM